MPRKLANQGSRKMKQKPKKKKRTFARLQLMENTHNIINGNDRGREREKESKQLQTISNTQPKGQSEREVKERERKSRERKQGARKILWELSMQ